MTTGYSRSPRLLKGAIIQFSAPLFVPIPNIIVFQYNPETMSRSFSPWAPPTDKQMKDDPKIEENLAQPYDPEESLNIALELDAADELENPIAHPQTVISGVADRIAALELLLYPPKSSAIGGLVGSAIGAPAGATLSVSSSGFGLSTPSAAFVKAERKEVPIVLFFFGPGRIVPVRITTFTVDEQAYNPLLYPIRAKVSLGLKVLLPEALHNDGSAVYKIAVACYRFTMAQKETLALARNAENAVDAITALLPF
jgi:hypothetical protein